MRLRSAADPEGTSRLAAAEVAAVCRDAVELRSLAVIALSGGETPWLMLHELRTFELPWNRIYVGQVDERIAPAGDPRRNRVRLQEILVRDGPLPASRLLPMPVEGDDHEAAAAEYQRLLEHYTGTPARLDLVLLGLGADGHTASLVPGDTVLQVRDRDVALTGVYQGLRRMTLTYPILSRARERIWLVTGASKSGPLDDLLAGTGDAPAVAITREDTLVIADAHALAVSRADGTGSE